MDDKKLILHDKRWDVYMNGKEALIKGVYSVEVVGSDGKNFLWELVDDHVVDEGNDYGEIEV